MIARPSAGNPVREGVRGRDLAIGHGRMRLPHHERSQRNERGEFHAEHHGQSGRRRTRPAANRDTRYKPVPKPIPNAA